MYKMIVLDMDGTLLNERQEISKENRIAIKKAVEKGVKVVLASGRAFYGMKPYLEELDLIKKGNYSISCSGALALDNFNHEILHEIPIEHSDLLKILRVSEDFDLDISAYTKESMLIHKNNLFSQYDAIANSVVLETVDFHKLKPETEIFKVNLINEAPQIREDIIKYFPSIKAESMDMREKPNFNINLLDELWRLPRDIIDHYTVVKSLPFCVEILDKRCNKAVGVEAVAKAFGIKRDEIICMGDSGNDLHMIEYAGLGIGMGNAYEQIKEVADEVTLTNEENGVAHIIEKYIL